MEVDGNGLLSDHPEYQTCGELHFHVRFSVDSLFTPLWDPPKKTASHPGKSRMQNQVPAERSVQVP